MRDKNLYLRIHKKEEGVKFELVYLFMQWYIKKLLMELLLFYGSFSDFLYLPHMMLSYDVLDIKIVKKGLQIDICNLFQFYISDLLRPINGKICKIIKIGN